MSRSNELFQNACSLIPGGVNSPVRAFKGVGGTPIFFNSADGAYLTDVDSKSYIDYVGSWGPMILGHRHPKVVSAITEALENGISFGAPTLYEIKLAQKIISLMPNIEKIRMVSSGTEATLTAIRLARGYTGKAKIIKFNGCYHGHHDSLLVKAGSGSLTLSIPSSSGIPSNVCRDTLTADFNNLAQVEACFKAYKDDIAALIIEPIAGNMGFILPEEGFLMSLRALCSKYNTLLIFDEVMTGFRVALGGAQELYKIKPDLTTLGKVIGGGMPIGAVGGREEIMSCLAPEGAIYQAGTLSGHPLSMAAGYATLQELEAPNFFNNLAKVTQNLVSGLKKIANFHKIPFGASSVGGMFGFCFNELEKITNMKDVAASNEALFKRFYHGMLSEGVYLAPSMYEAGFVSSAHSQVEIDKTIATMDKVLMDVNIAFSVLT
ncbi:MAG: glutamate-1-semialdehyde-2,1-aminomutase [Legionellales bacterium RIFCSPHIGHO2_12_FULL_37_14]|nr:MAG: glutamate-1-semialdehyde-2,1-aminomutase [Legionellales bacterium RIFCSPHIGHO2_12_FULL_37_14]